MALQLYKPEEATRSRGGIAFMLGALALYSVTSLYDFLAIPFWQNDLGGALLGDEFPISLRVILSAALLSAYALGIYMLCNTPKIVEFLIQTEKEMQKVSWPPKHEIISSSIAVIVTTIVLAIYLGVVDYGLIMFKELPDWDGFWSKVF